MNEALLSLAFLACPIGMGLMMWFMARGPRSASPGAGASVEQLREEHQRLEAEIDRLTDVRPDALRPSA